MNKPIKSTKPDMVTKHCLFQSINKHGITKLSKDRFSKILIIAAILILTGLFVQCSMKYIKTTEEYLMDQEDLKEKFLTEEKDSYDELDFKAKYLIQLSFVSDYTRYLYKVRRTNKFLKFLSTFATFVSGTAILVLNAIPEDAFKMGNLSGAQGRTILGSIIALPFSGISLFFNIFVLDKYMNAQTQSIAILGEAIRLSNETISINPNGFMHGYLQLCDAKNKADQLTNSAEGLINEDEMDKLMDQLDEFTVAPDPENAEESVPATTTENASISAPDAAEPQIPQVNESLENPSSETEDSANPETENPDSQLED